MTKRILTGIKPTGRPHLGNYVGMIRPTLDLIESQPKDAQSFVFIANYHALNSIDSAHKMREYTYDIAATMLACGLDPDKSAFYRQSDIREIFELSVILNSVTPKGLMNRAHAYKAAIDKNQENQSKDVDQGINMGLYTYPILMTADILIFDSNIVPVGKDQIQHVEFARDIAGYFNHKYAQDIFVLPEHKVKEDVASSPGLDGRKMSKSYGNTLPIFENAKTIEKLVKKIKTDSKLPEEPKQADDLVLFMIYQSVADSTQVADYKMRLEQGGFGYGDAKRELYELIIDMFADAKVKYDNYIADTKQLEEILTEGANKVRPLAEEKMQAVRSAVGVL